MLEHDLPRYVPARGIVGHGNCEVRMCTVSSASTCQGRHSSPYSHASAALPVRHLAKEALYLLPSHPTTAGSSFVSQEDWVGERGSLQQEKGLPVHGFTLGELSPR